MSKRPPGSFFRDRKKKIEAEKLELAKQWEKNAEKLSDGSLDVDGNEINIEQNEKEINKNTFEVSLESQNKYEHFKVTNFSEILFDNPRSWYPINDKLRSILILHGPNRGITAPKPFKNHWFLKQMNNGEKCDRTWMIYSEPNETIFCFCCILFGTKSSALIDPKQGFTNWKKMERLREHENSSDHVKNFLEWKIFEKKLKNGGAIDDCLQN
ncbi:zinc finger MYM-type protein 5-like [Melanaphis sacchari]|uniref:zinc finger MYM-type protein 5-like n=1 Tax=Melanaphis sacchari TaxID=742174 RepID=UPI000DC134CE|nr:zinc finger MYM-type protein 5-like [Melanaphis sacchari]